MAVKRKVIYPRESQFWKRKQSNKTFKSNYENDRIKDVNKQHLKIDQESLEVLSNKTEQNEVCTRSLCSSEHEICKRNYQRNFLIQN